MDIDGDFLIIGSGIAGLRAALALSEAGRVIVLTKADPTESNTGYAQGGIAAAVGPDDSTGLHARDTIAAGDALCATEAVDVLVREGPLRVRELLDWGVAFDRDEQGQPALAREAAHSVRRVLHARDATGREIGRVLWSRVSADRRITVLDDALAVALTVGAAGCAGAHFVNGVGEAGVASARCTLLATGGAGQVFRETTNPSVASGDGIAIAAEAGARVADLEFVQFHPTVLSVAHAPRFLLSEALRGEGARLVNAAGERFMQRYEAAGDLAARDLVARAIVREQARTGASVYLTLAHLEPHFVRQRFPTIARACANIGLDLATDRIPVSPAAHYVMGGVETDLDGRTSIPALFAAGEVACTGVHGANRLASNSLLEGLVFGVRAAMAMQRSVCEPALDGTNVVIGAIHRTCDRWPSESEVRDMMWRSVGLLRDRAGLNESVSQLDRWAGALCTHDTSRSTREARRLKSLVTVGLLIARAALRREESRGAHYRTDFPERDDLHWKRHVSEVVGL